MKPKPSQDEMYEYYALGIVKAVNSFVNENADKRKITEIDIAEAILPSCIKIFDGIKTDAISKTRQDERTHPHAIGFGADSGREVRQYLLDRAMKGKLSLLTPEVKKDIQKQTISKVFADKDMKEIEFRIDTLLDCRTRKSIQALFKNIKQKFGSGKSEKKKA